MASDATALMGLRKSRFVMQNTRITRKTKTLTVLLQWGAWILLALAGLSAGALQAQVPTVTAFSPSSGSCGTTVVITGTDFSGVTGVKFGGANAALFTVNSSTQITATVAGSASGSVTVENGNGTGSLAGFTHLDVTPPTLTCPPALTINNSPGLCTGATTLVAPLAPDNCDVIGNGLNFDGSNDYVAFNGFNITTNTLTIECWIKPNGPQGASDGIVYRRGVAVPTGLAIGDADPTKIGYTWNNQSNTFSWSGGPVYNVNVWNHVALVIEPSQATIYLNGVGYVNTVSHPAINLSGIYRLGQDDYASRLFNGAIDEVRVWNYSRTQAQIQANMSHELGPQAGLIVGFHLNHGTAGGANPGLTTAMDFSGNNLNGTLNNFALSGSSSNWIEGTVTIPNAVVTNNAPGTYQMGNTSVVWTATDPMGNSSTCAQTVTVVDNVAPVVTCPANQTLSAGTNCNAIATYAANATDLCSTPTLSYSPASGSTLSSGVTTVTALATDVAGNSSTCSFTVTVTEVTPPSIICPANVTAAAGPGCVSTAIVTYSASMTDNCAGGSIAFSPTSGSTFSAGSSTVTATASDASGNTAACTFTVTVTTPVALVVTAANSGIVCVNANTASVLANASGGTPGYTYLWSPSNLTTSSLTGVGAGTHSVTVTDARGCTATGSTTVGTHPVTPSTFNVSQ
jgi:hypothetical protein